MLVSLTLLTSFNSIANRASLQPPSIFALKHGPHQCLIVILRLNVVSPISLSFLVLLNYTSL